MTVVYDDPSVYDDLYSYNDLPIPALILPPDEVINQIHASVTKITSRVDIYEADGVTLWLQDAPVITGSVSISGVRDERRTCSLTFANTNGVLSSDPEGFWYDKILKLYRGVAYIDENNLPAVWEIQLGEFLIDTINAPHFPRTSEVGARDQTKRLLTAKFATSTTFAINQPIEEVIRAIAINGGIPATKISFPLTGKSTGREFMFDRGTERWRAMTQIANAYNYDLWFRADGVLTMDVFKDPSNPAISPSEYRFEVGPGFNRIPNESFETGLSGNSARAAGWQYDYDTDASPGFTFARPKGSAFNGDHSLAIINTSTSGTSVAADSIPVVAGEIWRISYAARASAATTTGRYLRVFFHTVDNGQEGGAGQVSFTTPHSNLAFPLDWTEYTVDVTVPANVTYMRVVVYAWTSGQEYAGYFDVVTAVKIAPILEDQGNIATYSKSTADARLYNHIVVTGESSDTVPVTGIAENNHPDSPTRIARIGRRTYFYTSSFITTQAQAQEVADRFLKVHALEQFDVNIGAIVVPYLDANIIVDFIDPDPTSAAPIRFLLSELTMPLDKGVLAATAKRVTIVGA